MNELDIDGLVSQLKSKDPQDVIFTLNIIKDVGLSEEEKQELRIKLEATPGGHRKWRSYAGQWCWSQERPGKVFIYNLSNLLNSMQMYQNDLVYI